MRAIPGIKHFLFGLAISLSSCSKNDRRAAQQQAAAYPVIEVPARTIRVQKRYPTHIEGIVNSDIRSKIEGYIKKVLVDEGAHVHQGQPLFELETQSLSRDADAAKAKVHAARVEVDKLVPLVEKGIVSPVQLETAKAELEVAKSRYSSIAAQISYATVKSPTAGFVGAIAFRAGALVGPNDPRPLTRVADIDRVYAYFSMGEVDYLNFLQSTPGKNLREKLQSFPPVSLTLANGETYGRRGKIQTASGQINSHTGTVRFRAIFDNPNHLIANGSNGMVNIPITYKNTAVVPQSATYERQGQTYVYKISTDKRAKATAISIRAGVDNLYAIRSGVKEGDKIVAKGIEKLRDNALIRLREAAFDSIAKPVEKLFK